MARRGFAGSGELRAVMDLLFGLLSSDPQFGPALRAAGTRQRFVFTDLGETLDVAPAEEGSGALRWAWGGDPGWEPDVTLRLRSDVANAFWQGRLNPALAVAMGKIKTSGDLSQALRLGPVIRPVHPRYRALLAEHGYAHLLL